MSGPATLPTAQTDPAPDLQGAVLHPAVVGVKELLEPLEELEIVLELLLGQLVYIYSLRGRVSGYLTC